MKLSPLTRSFDALLHVCRNMREWDKREIFAMRFDDEPLHLAMEIMRSPECGWVAGKDEPIAAFGAIPLWPGVWSVWCFGTDQFPSIGLGITRFIKRHMTPAIKAAGGHRAQCYSIEGHDYAHRWLGALGAQRESTHHNFGRNCETFHLYSWRN